MAGSAKKIIQKDTRRKRGSQNFGWQWWRKLTLPRRGAKQSLLAPTTLTPTQEKEIEKRRQTSQRATEAPRVGRAKQFVVANWIESRRIAKVVRHKGTLVSSMGVFEDGSQYLWPEEAFYLVDRGTMDLNVEQVPCSVQKAWALCCDGGREWLDRYSAYSHLKRAGYVVRRPQSKKGNADGENDAAIEADFLVWRAGAFKRRVVVRPLFCVLVYNFQEKPPMHKDIAVFCGSSGRTRVRAALVDRGVVVLFDLACNATPLSERFAARFAAERQKLLSEGSDSVDTAKSPHINRENSEPGIETPKSKLNVPIYQRNPGARTPRETPH